MYRSANVDHAPASRHRYTRLGLAGLLGAVVSAAPLTGPQGLQSGAQAELARFAFIPPIYRPRIAVPASERLARLAALENAAPEPASEPAPKVAPAAPVPTAAEPETVHWIAMGSWRGSDALAVALAPPEPLGTSGGTLVLFDLPAGTTVSAGRPLGPDAWTLPLSRAPGTMMLASPAPETAVRIAAYAGDGAELATGTLKLIAPHLAATPPMANATSRDVELSADSLMPLAMPDSGQSTAIMAAAVTPGGTFPSPVATHPTPVRAVEPAAPFIPPAGLALPSEPPVVDVLDDEPPPPPARVLAWRKEIEQQAEAQASRRSTRAVRSRPAASQSAGGATGTTWSSLVLNNR